MRIQLQDQIEDTELREAVRLLDAGDAEGLRELLRQHPGLQRRRVTFEGRNYFRTPTLLEFAAENPLRHGSLPGNIVQVAEVILDAGVEQAALNETLMLVCSGSVARECGMQVPLIELLCGRGAAVGSALQPAAVHGEFEAVRALLQRGARLDLPIAAALGRLDDCQRLLPAASAEVRHLALAMAAPFGRAEIVSLLLDAGADPNRCTQGAHAYSTPLHQAALAGHENVVRLLVERGARVDMRDTIWDGTPADWAKHEGRTGVESYLRAQMRE